MQIVHMKFKKKTSNAGDSKRFWTCLSCIKNMAHGDYYSIAKKFQKFNGVYSKNSLPFI